jgi:hypothetical protein
MGWRVACTFSAASCSAVFVHAYRARLGARVIAKPARVARLVFRADVVIAVLVEFAREGKLLCGASRYAQPAPLAVFGFDFYVTGQGCILYLRK